MQGPSSWKSPRLLKSDQNSACSSLSLRFFFCPSVHFQVSLSVRFSCLREGLERDDAHLPSTPTCCCFLFHPRLFLCLLALSPSCRFSPLYPKVRSTTPPTRPRHHTISCVLYNLKCLATPAASGPLYAFQSGRSRPRGPGSVVGTRCLAEPSRSSFPMDGDEPTQGQCCLPVAASAAPPSDATSSCNRGNRFAD